MDDDKELHLLGVSFRTAPVAVREALSFTGDDAHQLLRAAAEHIPGVELMMLSTCNRTEFYLAGPRGVAPVERFLGLLRQLRPNAPVLSEDCARYSWHGVEAARHLFRVAAGLDSAILGDAQILGQVKAMMAAASQAGTLGPVLHEAVIQAIKTGKQARATTQIGHGAASIGSAILSVIAEHERSLRRARVVPRVLIVGAGETARDIGRHAAKGGEREVTFLNRTHQKAVRLAVDCGGKALAWESFRDALAQHHFIITATSCPKPFLTRAEIQAAAASHSALRLVIDAGVPRNAEPDLGVPTVDIDGIRDLREAALARRTAAVPEVGHIVEESVRRWEHWMGRRPVERVIQSLYHEVGRDSLEAAEALANGDVELARVAQSSLHRSMRRVLRGHARALRRVASWPALVATREAA